MEEIRLDCGVSRNGSSAKNIVLTARKHGLDAWGFRYEPDELREEGIFPCIIHWNFHHFVVLNGFKGKKAVITDPAKGVYTVGEEKTAELIELAHEENYKIHTHLSETMTEIKNCMEQFGCTPVEFWKRLGGLNSNFSAAHCTHFTASDRKIFAESGATAILNPCSNMKLNSGIPQVAEMIKDGMKLGLGTDGDSSNNNLDMQEEMKTIALLAKYLGTAETLPAEDALKMATCNVAQFFGINAGRIAEGYLADCLLIDLNAITSIATGSILQILVQLTLSCAMVSS